MDAGAQTSHDKWGSSGPHSMNQLGFATKDMKNMSKVARKVPKGNRR